MRAPSKLFLTFFLFAAVWFFRPGIALGNDALQLYPGDPSLFWLETDLILQGQAPVTAIYPVSKGELVSRGLMVGEDAEEPADNSFSFTLRPLAGFFSLPTVAPLGRNGKTWGPVATMMYWTLPPFAEIEDTLSVGNWLNLHLGYDQRFDAGKMAHSGGSLFGAYLFESGFPRVGSLSLSFDHFDLTAGRTKAGIGYGFFGNTILNGQANYYDHIRFSAYAGNFKFFYLCGTSDPLLTPVEQVIQNTAWAFPVYNEPAKTYTYKRVEYRPFQQILLGLGEASVLGGVQPDLRNLNPFGLAHNTYSYGYQNSIFSLDASAVPFKGFHLFGEFLLDDLRLKREGGSRMPTALAWQAGARYVFDATPDLRLMAGLEYTHIDPWTYGAFQPYLMFYQRQSYCSSAGDWYMDQPLGYAFGSDLDHFGTYLRAVSRSGLDCRLSYYHMVQGEVELGAYDGTQSWYNLNDQVSLNNGHVGTPELYDSIGLSLSWAATKNLSVVGTGQYTWIRNFEHNPGAFGTLYLIAVGVEYRL